MASRQLDNQITVIRFRIISALTATLYRIQHGRSMQYAGQVMAHVRFGSLADIEAISALPPKADVD